jgi:NTP pyrophosphatase (non-canonical NTP hydrolase)
MSSLELPKELTLKDIQEYVDAMATERGFNRTDIAKKFMMLSEEVGELAKAARKRAGMKLADDASTTDVRDEAADVLIVFVGLCNMLGIDLEQALREKEEKNKKRNWQ